MFRTSALFFCLLLVAGNSERVKREEVRDHGKDLLVCTEDSIEFAFGIDSSASISQNDFNLAQLFVSDLLFRYDIGNEKEQSRAAVFTYGDHVYTQDAFGLNAYLDPHKLRDAINAIKHQVSSRTNTSKAIDYIHDVALSSDKVRPGAEKVGIIITDGDNKDHTMTAEASQRARDDGIIMIAIGVGPETQISDEELLAIAGNKSFVLRVLSYHSLRANENLVRRLYHEHCHTIPKPTEPPCGAVNPTDMFFVFSPRDLGPHITWAQTFITTLLASDEFNVGFQAGIEDCPVDTGRDGNLTYDLAAVAEAVKNSGNKTKYQLACDLDVGNDTKDDDHFYLPDVVQRLVDSHYSMFTSYHRSVAIIISDYHSHFKDFIDAQAETLVKDGAVEVFIALTSDVDVTSYYDFQIQGKTPEEQAKNFIGRMCTHQLIIGNP